MKARAALLVLASGSHARRTMLENAGLNFDVIPADIDEASIMADMVAAHSTPTDIALKLAQEKAIAVSQAQADALVIGSDQVLELEGAIMSKAADQHGAREKLRALRGREHRLISAVSVVQGGAVLWSHADDVRLHMHDFDDDFLDLYCENAGEALTRAVGAYEFEALGSWLFSTIEGNYFTILGMPLLPLLTYLRTQHGAHP